MTQNDAFLQAIIENPDDDAPRLIYADYLEEYGQPERAGLIRVQCELASGSAGALRKRVLRLRERQLLKAHGDRWAPRPSRGLLSYEFRRGFVEWVRLQGQTFVAHAPALFRLGPLRELYFVGAARHILSLAFSPYLARVEVLGLGRNHLSDTSVRFLALSSNLSRLTWLDLGENRIGDMGARDLAYAPGLAGLKTLLLGANRIGEAGAHRQLIGVYQVTLLFSPELPAPRLWTRKWEVPSCTSLSSWLRTCRWRVRVP